MRMRFTHMMRLQDGKILSYELLLNETIPNSEGRFLINI